MRRALPAVFFLSGAASLLFETLWFRLAGLAFGNSAIASAIVLAAFMAGLATGNLLAPRLASRGRRALRIYAGLEIGIGVCGLALVLLLPLLPAALVPLYRTVAATNALRLVFAFALLLVPSTMMGATLPAIVAALSERDANFGRVLGILYGCNTIGAVAGALAGELLLIGAFGMRGTGVVAALCSLTAGAAAFLLGNRATGQPGNPATQQPSNPATGNPMPLVLLAAAFLSGFALLALEVIWFRFIALWVNATSVAFAVMLAVVLAGIGLGALIAAGTAARFDKPGVVAALSAVFVVLGYAGFAPIGHVAAGGGTLQVLVDSVRLMLPVSALSGILFTLIGRAIERRVGEELRATAMMTFANTAGAAAGPIVAGFVLIPNLGVEKAFFAIAALYVVVALCAGARWFALAGAAALLFFPFGAMRREFLPLATNRFASSQLVALREGRTETSMLLRSDFAGRPYLYRLFTNGYSMSATSFASKRYMSAFVYLPLALRPRAQSALLISYGVGVTAKRLTESHQLSSIDIVDISRDILGLSPLVWPGAANPLADRRARVHVEDGRFFLLATPRRFDLITAEPPPPKNAGIVNLYTREYFSLVRDRLTDGGIASYWLPVYQLHASDTRAIIRGFCDAFADCSLWSGAGAEWILVGSRGAAARPSYSEFSAQWRDPVAAPQLARLGIESPEQLATMYLGDAAMLRRYAAETPPLTDDFPLRLSPAPATAIDASYIRVIDDAPREFAGSAYVRSILPPEVVAAAPPAYAAESILNRRLLIPGASLPRPEVSLLRTLLTTTNLRTLPRLLFGSDAWLEEIAIERRAAGDRNPSYAALAAIGALSDRDYARAAALFAEARMPQYEALAKSLAQSPNR